ncbi:MAG TPA: hypothetical protein VIW25_15280 [Nitrososphaeraceae archaeon]
MQILKEETPFVHKAIAALAISIVSDALDYFAAPLFDIPVIGDVFDVITTSLLYSITRSKVSTAINTIEFIPIIGDFIPIYTISTLLWISRESKKENKKVAEKNCLMQRG